MSDLREKIIEFISQRLPSEVKMKILKAGGQSLFTCPECQIESACAIFIPGTGTVSCQNPSCGFNGDICDIVQMFDEDSRELSKEQIAGYLRDKYQIIVSSIDADFYLDFYYKNNFDLVPLIKAQKVPFEKDWLNKEHKNPDEWKKFLENQFNIGVKTGKRSGITVIDVDTPEIPAILKDVDTIIQKTNKGYHFLFQYEEDMPSCRFDDIKVDVLNDGKQFVVYPSKVADVVRIWNFSITNPKKISKMPFDVRKFFTSKKGAIQEFNNDEEKLKEEIKNEDLKGLAEVAEGNRTNTLIKLGGVLRKQLNPQQTQHVLELFNRNFIKNPLPGREVFNIVNSLDKYATNDDMGLCNRIVEYLRYAEEGTSKDIEQALGEKKAKIDKALAHLIKEMILIKRGRMFHLVKRADWKDTYPSLVPRINFEMPYFDDIAHFNWGDMILLGSKAKFGKTTISINILKRLIAQGIKPYYICLEPGSRFIQTAVSLGIKEGDFFWDIQTDPMTVDLEPNAVTILDWLMIEDKSQTDVIMHHFIKQLVRTNGILIVFQQCKTDGSWFAPNMATQFPAFAARYLYENEESGEFGAWHVDAIREAKRHMKKGNIPCQYLYDEKRLVRVDELNKPTTINVENEGEVPILT